MSIRKSLIVLGVAVSGAASAQAMTCSAKLGPAEQIACLQTQNAVLKEMIATKELYKKLDEGDKKPRVLDLPTVLSIFGASGRVQAVLSYAGTGGGQVTVAPGDSLPDGWRVASIDNGRVMISKGKVSHLLLLSGGSPEQSAPTVSASPSTLPSISGVASPATTVPPFPAMQGASLMGAR